MFIHHIYIYILYIHKHVYMYIYIYIIIIYIYDNGSGGIGVNGVCVEENRRLGHAHWTQGYTCRTRAVTTPHQL